MFTVGCYGHIYVAAVFQHPASLWVYKWFTSVRSLLILNSHYLLPSPVNVTHAHRNHDCHIQPNSICRAVASIRSIRASRLAWQHQCHENKHSTRTLKSYRSQWQKRRRDHRRHSVRGFTQISRNGRTPRSSNPREKPFRFDLHIRNH